MADPNFPTNRYELEHERIKRRLAMAQSISRQAAEPIEAPSVPGARLSPYTALIKALQGGLGGYLEGKANRAEQQFGAKMEEFRRQDMTAIDKGIAVPPLVQPAVGKALNLGQVPTPPSSVSPGAEMTTRPYAIETGSAAPGSEQEKWVNEQEILKAPDVTINTALPALLTSSGQMPNPLYREKYTQPGQDPQAIDKTGVKKTPKRTAREEGEELNYDVDVATFENRKARAQDMILRENQQLLLAKSLSQMVLPDNATLIDGYGNTIAGRRKPAPLVPVAPGTSLFDPNTGKTILQTPPTPTTPQRLSAKEQFIKAFIAANPGQDQAQATRAFEEQSDPRLSPELVRDTNQGFEARWRQNNNPGELPIFLRLPLGISLADADRRIKSFDSLQNEFVDKQRRVEDLKNYAQNTDSAQFFDLKQKRMAVIADQEKIAVGSLDKLRKAYYLLGSDDPNAKVLATGQAVGLINFISSISAGESSGVRITNVELDRVIAAIGIKEKFAVWRSKVTNDPLVLGDMQAKEMRTVLEGLEDLLVTKINQGRDSAPAIYGAKNQKELFALIEKETKQLGDALSKGITSGTFVPNKKQ